MKKSIFILLVVFTSTSVHAQLKNTKWKGTIQADNTLNVVFDYRSDTLEVTNSDDGSNIETMTYTVKDTVLTLRKISGQSSCDTEGTGKYRFEIKDDALHLTQISDNCNDRTSALSNSKWTRVK
jgi:hypothetical protein